MSAGSGAMAPRASDCQHGPCAMHIQGVFFASHRIEMAKCFSLWGPSIQELNSAEFFCSEPVAMIHVVITAADLTRPGCLFDVGHNRARAASRIAFVPRVLVSGLTLEPWFWRCARNEPAVRLDRLT